MEAMQAAAVFNGIEQRPDVRAHAEQSRELQDVLSPMVPTFRRTEFPCLVNKAVVGVVQHGPLSEVQALEAYLATGDAQYLGEPVTRCQE
jgi:hypothetical protein